MPAYRIRKIGLLDLVEIDDIGLAYDVNCWKRTHRTRVGNGQVSSALRLVPRRPRMKAKAKPEGYHTLNPILRVPNAAVALDFYKAAFNANEDFRREMQGRLLIALIMIGDSRIMISDQQNDPDKVSGGDPRGNGLELKIYVDGVDEVFRRAIGCGATEETAVQDSYWGERSGSLVDPFGFTWRLAEFLEDVPHEEIERRMREDAAN
jgi:PhnB protein